VLRRNSCSQVDADFALPTSSASGLYYLLLYGTCIATLLAVGG